METKWEVSLSIDPEIGKTDAIHLRFLFTLLYYVITLPVMRSLITRAEICLETSIKCDLLELSAVRIRAHEKCGQGARRSLTLVTYFITAFV